MAPRKKKPPADSKKATTGPKKALVEAKKGPIQRKKTAPKKIPKNPRTKRKVTKKVQTGSTETLETIEPKTTTENPEESSLESQELNSLDDGVVTENEDTAKVTEQLGNLEVQDELEMELVEFDSIENVITVSCETQEDAGAAPEEEEELTEKSDSTKTDQTLIELKMEENTELPSAASEEKPITELKELIDTLKFEETSDSEESKPVKQEENDPELETKTEEEQKPKVQKKEPKKKGKGKAVKTKAKVNDIEDSLIRRSNRIKSISVLKKPAVGHGLVKTKDVEAADPKIESDKVVPVLTPPLVNEPADKPIKVKSRWRRSCELEMNGTNAAAALNANLRLNEASNEKTGEKDETVENRLKQFTHVKENTYLTERLICKEAKKMTCDCFLTHEEKNRGEMACGDDCLNRLLMIECGNLCPVGDRCANKKFQKGQFAPVEVFNTDKKGLGLRAAANIPYGEFILEYVGEVLSADEFGKRADEYSQDKNQHYYFMSLRSDAIIDATQKGNISRFINHSCEPNAETQKWTVNGELRIGFFSTRTILAGEEVTFDYRFQRYGKEAQKCYCEMPTCRGWLGEEPDEDDDEDEDEDEPSETSVVEPVEAATADKENESSMEIKTEEAEAAKTSKVENLEAKPKIKKSRQRRKLRKELFEDDQLDVDIEMLVTTGLKNQAHTLKLSRLIVRAKEPIQRSKLLKVLRRGELPCRRLFLDYHGLRLMHGYMTDAQQWCKNDRKHDSLRLEIMQTLAVLPIQNKTMLQDSKVLETVEKWSVPLTCDSPVVDSESNSPQINIQSQEDIDAIEHIRRTVAMNENVIDDQSRFANSSGSALADEIADLFENETFVPSRPKPRPPLSSTGLKYEEEITSLAVKLLEAWSNLKEVFRIPKKERIEQMKEHEREANKGYIAEQYAEKRNDSRYRGMQRTSQRSQPSSSDKKTNLKTDPAHQSSGLSKYDRRKLFAMQVDQQEEERRRKQREMWRQHERNCMVIGTDPRLTAPFDPSRGYQCIWNPQLGQWQNVPLPPPTAYPPYGVIAGMTPPLAGRALPSMVPGARPPPPQIIPQIDTSIPPPTSPATPNLYPTYNQPHPLVYQQSPQQSDKKSTEVITIMGGVKFLGQIPPPAPLPPKWKCAKDKYGRPYYYHVRIRKSQWVPPPVENLEEESATSSSSSSSSSSETSSDDSGDSDDDIMNDSRLLRQVKKQMEEKLKVSTVLAKKLIEKTVPVEEKKPASPPIEITIEGQTKEDTASKETNADVDLEETPLDKRLKEQFNSLNEEEAGVKRKKGCLVQELIISPRTDEDKQQFREDVKRYRENKVLLKKQKEAILQQTKKHKKDKTKQVSKGKGNELKYCNTEQAKKIKETFRATMATTVVSVLNVYTKADCKEGRITNTDDFKHLARKLTHFVMLKEMKHITKIEELVCSDNVKAKAKDYIRKYMGKFGETYVKRNDEPDHFY